MRFELESVREAVCSLHELSCLFPVVRKAIAATEDPDCTNHQLEKILAADQGLSARVLRLANSAYFGVNGDVSTLSMAVALIGYRRLRMLLRHVLVTEMFELLSARGPETTPTWEVGVTCGVLAHEIARLSWVGDPEELLNVGLLHNIGELALLSRFYEPYQEVRRMAETMSQSEAEVAVFGVDSNQVGCWLLETWSFPSIFGMGCAFWRYPFDPAVDPSLRERLCVLHSAVHLAHAYKNGSASADGFATILPEVVDQLALEETAIGKIYGELPGRVAQVRAILET